jgi:hypothetical protein
MPKALSSDWIGHASGGAKKRVWVAMMTLFTAALVVSLVFGIYGIATS